MHRYLEHEALPAEHDVADLKPLLFMDPSVMSCLMLSADEPDEIKALADGLEVASKQVLLVAINDNDSFERRSNHWSLLIAYKSAAAVHYTHIDSSSGFNKTAAERNAQELRALFGTDVKHAPVLHLDRTPQQQNGWDCGMYCTLSAGVAARYLLQGKSLRFDGSADAAELVAMLTAALTEKSVTFERARMHEYGKQLLKEAAEPVAAAAAKRQKV